MLRRRVYRKLLVVSMLTSMIPFAGNAFGQSPATRSESQQKETASSEPRATPIDNKTAAPTVRTDLEKEVETLKAENAAVRELLRKMEEQQKTLLENVERLQRRLDGGETANVQAQTVPLAADATTPATTPALPTDAEADSAKPAPAQADQGRGGIYNDGIIIWETGEDAKVPFQLKFTNTTQVRYLNTL